MTTATLTAPQTGQQKAQGGRLDVGEVLTNQAHEGELQRIGGSTAPATSGVFAANTSEGQRRLRRSGRTFQLGNCS